MYITLSLIISMCATAACCKDNSPIDINWDNPEPTPEETCKENPLVTVWTGEQEINWSKDGCFYIVDAQSFAKVEAGLKIRFNAKNVNVGAIGNIRKIDWSGMAVDIPFAGTFYEWEITEDMAAELKTEGCIVGGYGHTLTSIQLIDPAKIPDVKCQLVAEDIKVWEEGSTPIIRINAENRQTVAFDVTATLSLRDDHHNHIGELSITENVGAKEAKTITFDLSILMKTPGFYHAVVVANYSEVCSYNIGYAPEEISSPIDCRPDFDSFWDKAKSELAAVAPEYKVTLIPKKSTGARNIYFVEMKSIDNGDGQPVTIRGYLAEPKKVGKYPAIIYQNGYEDTNIDGNSEFFHWLDTNGNPEWIEFNLSVRGQGVNNRNPYKETDNIYGDYFAYNFGNKDRYYYRGAFMDVIRSIDFVMSRENTDKDNVFMAGGSQGGALTIAGAALDNRLNAIAPTVQFLCDFPDYFQVGTWPGNVAFAKSSELGICETAMYEFLSYFDIKNHAKNVTCPVKSVLGLQDDVCPPHIGMSAINNMASEEKIYAIDPMSGHNASNDAMPFFKSHLK